jgi:hypothetical protein
LRATPLAAPLRNTSPVPSPAPSLAPGAPLCAGCSKAQFALEVTGETLVGDPAKCSACRRLTRFQFTPQVTPDRHDQPSYNSRLCVCGARRDHHTTVGGQTFSAMTGAVLCRGFVPMPVPEAPPTRFIVGPGDAIGTGCAIIRGLERSQLEEVAAGAPCVDCGLSTCFRLKAAPPTSRDVGEPFGVKLAETAGWHSVEVRNAAGIVAYVHVGLESADAARWSALSWLRGQQRDVAAADAPALAERFRAEAIAYVPPVVAPAGDLAAQLAHVDAPAVTPADDDPHEALMAAAISEPLRDRLLAWLQAREQTWEDLADEASSPDTIGEAKYVADIELVQVFSAIGGAL